MRNRINQPVLTMIAIVAVLLEASALQAQPGSVIRSRTKALTQSESASAPNSSGPLKAGTYTLKPMNATGSRLDATGGSKTSGTQLQIWTDGPGNPNQEWIVTAEADGTYKIQPSYDKDLAVGVAGSSKDNGASVQLLTDNNGSNERWKLTPADGGYTLTPQNSTGSTMNVAGPSSANGTHVQIWQATGGTNTVFAFGKS